ncbi:MAG: hypothetical protein E3J35_00005 [Methanomassiliicoccales archaeon]|nr:MAG: hypothetical protein E3J35_00005 [Methanomassiliicoccales archaeon]
MRDSSHKFTNRVRGLHQKGSRARDENVEAHRRGFTQDFTNAMKEILLERGREIEVEYPDLPEFEDIAGELEELHRGIEDDIEKGDYEPEEGEEEEG